MCIKLLEYFSENLINNLQRNLHFYYKYINNKEFFSLFDHSFKSLKTFIISIFIIFFFNNLIFLFYWIIII